MITSIAPGSKAEMAGLRVGDRVVNLNGIDTAHLSLIDAAHLMRREQSDVTLMRVGRNGNDVEEEDLDEDYNEDDAGVGRTGRLISLQTGGPPNINVLPEHYSQWPCGHQCCHQNAFAPTQGK